MAKLVVGLAVMGVVAIFSTIASAGCSCSCVNGQYRATCSSPFDIPPICALRTCPLDLTPRTPPIGAGGSCSQQQQCDIYGHCEWKQVCR
jgi:hypothetical protein